MVHILLVIIYMAFISLGLPDSLLGAAWPAIHTELAIPNYYAGIIAMIIAVGTVVASLQSDNLTRRLGTGKVTAISVGITAAALFGFSLSNSFAALCLWAIPYGLGAGCVDASINNYVALHYSSRHMSWLHCMWGVGASTGPVVMEYALTSEMGWNMGYAYIGVLQIILTIILLLSLPLWKNKRSRLVSADKVSDTERGLSIKEIININGAKEIMIAFFCYSAIEQTSALWASSYLTIVAGVSIGEAAQYASLFYIGITVGRVISGFLTIIFNDKKMIRLGESIVAIGIVMLLIASNIEMIMISLILIGLGCAPIYPCIIHSTPDNFGADKSQAIIGVEMASAYIGTCLMPPLFGCIAEYANISCLPIFLAIALGVMLFMLERLNRKCNLQIE